MPSPSLTQTCKLLPDTDLKCSLIPTCARDQSRRTSASRVANATHPFTRPCRRIRLPEPEDFSPTVTLPMTSLIHSPIPVGEVYKSTTRPKASPSRRCLPLSHPSLRAMSAGESLADAAPPNPSSSRRNSKLAREPLADAAHPLAPPSGCRRSLLLALCQSLLPEPPIHSPVSVGDDGDYLSSPRASRRRMHSPVPIGEVQLVRGPLAVRVPVGEAYSCSPVAPEPLADTCQSSSAKSLISRRTVHQPPSLDVCCSWRY